jgi:ASC-1-like (ASCH) protein
VKGNGVTRPIDMKNFDADVENVWNIYNSAWERNWGFIPMSKQEFSFRARK